MRYGILIEKAQTVTVEGGRRVSSAPLKANKIDGALKKIIAEGEAFHTVYCSVREADEEGNFIPGATLVCGRHVTLAGLQDFFDEYQVDPETGIGREYVRPVVPPQAGENQDVFAIAQAAAKSAVAAVVKENEELKARIAALEAPPVDTEETPKKKGK